MDALARSHLEKLLAAGERSSAGLRALQASITEVKLSDYRSLTSLQKKDSFEQTLRAARAEGAIELVWDGRQDGEGFIRRVNLVDRGQLAHFLGKRLVEDQVEEAKSNLQMHAQIYPVLDEVFARWSSLKKCRGLGPESYPDWMDAIRVISECKSILSEGAVSFPVREFSARLFKDSKRIEKLIGPLDILLAGAMDGEIRKDPSVLQELGLFREEQPVLLAGNVVLERDRLTSCLDQPYIGLQAATIRRVVGPVKVLMTIENLTTFHSEAKRHCNEEILLIYTAGMPSPAWRAMYSRLLESLPADASIYHWGDVDEGGFRIAAMISGDAKFMGRVIKPWKMHPDDVPESSRRKASQHTLDRIRHFSEAAGWKHLGEAIFASGFTAEQESLS